MTEPLYNEAAEQAVLSAVLLDAEAINRACEIVDPESFYRPAHHRLFHAMQEVDSAGDVIDPLTLTDRLDALGLLDTVGGRDYIGYLVDVVPTGANVEYHAKIVAELATRRNAVRIGEALIAGARDRATPLTLTAQQTTSALLPVASASTHAGYRSLKSLAYDVMQDVENAALGKATGLSFGYPSLDVPTGGMVPGELLIVCSVPGAGKTAAAINIAIHAAERGETVGIVSAEMKDIALAKRILSNLAQVNGLAIRTGKIADHEFVALGRAAGQLTHLPIWIDDTPTPAIDLILARARTLKAEHPTLRWLLVDFIQLVQGKAGSDEIRALELTQIAYALKGLAKEIDAAVIATCQVDASGIEKRGDKRPQLSDMRWSQGMREAADMVALLYRPAMYDDDAEDVIEFDFKKARDLPPFKVTLDWVGAFMRMNEPPALPHQLRTRQDSFASLA